MDPLVFPKLLVRYNYYPFELNEKDEKIIHSSKDSIGWLGDVPVINYDISKIKDLGWKPKYNSEEAIRLAVRGMIDTN